MNRLARVAAAMLSAAALLLGLSFAIIALAGCKGEGGSSGGTETTSLDPAAEPEPPGDQPAFPFIDHVDQARITRGAIGFDELFVLGDELFETKFNALDGVGALRLPDDTSLPARFSRVPPGGGRFTGPNGAACNECHNTPFGTSAGGASGNVVQDPELAGAPPFNIRNTISLFGIGMIQRLAEEMTEKLLSIRDQAAAETLPGGPAVTRPLVAKGISFGEITAMRDAGGVVTFDTSGVMGVSADLVVRPFGWKGDHVTIREFSRIAARNEVGMEADELVARDPHGRADPDGDGIEGELSVGDITALVVYIAAQETPTTVGRAVRDGIMSPPGDAFRAAAARGSTLFDQIGCAGCHVRELRLEDPVFEEPTLRGGGNFRDTLIDVASTRLDPARPARFNLARQGDKPRPRPHPAGGVRVALLGDLRRHAMGSQLADARPTPVITAEGDQLVIDGSPVSVPTTEFMTPELWGVGSTGPWLHDGRAGSLEEAIVLHGVDSPPPPGDPARSEAQEARDAFMALADRDREAVVTFLKSLILVDLEELEGE